MFNWLRRLIEGMTNRKKLKEVPKDEMILIKKKDGSLVPLPLPGSKQVLVKYPDGTAEIKTVSHREVNKKDYGL